MISRQQFKKYLNIIKELQKKQNDFDNMLELFDLDSSVCTFLYMKPIDAITELLTLNFNLPEYNDTINYYIWETDWGKYGKECIELPDGTKISITDDDKLYNYLCMMGEYETNK